MITDITFDIRAQGDPLPLETATLGGDLTGHTVHLVIATNDGDVELAGTLGDVTGTGDDATTDVTFTDPSHLVPAIAAGTYRAAYIVDKDSPTLRETVGAGWFPIRDEPG